MFFNTVHQETIGKVLVCLKRESDTVKADKIEATVTALTDMELSDKEKREVLETVHRELANPERARSHRPRPTDFDNVYEDLGDCLLIFAVDVLEFILWILLSCSE